MGWEMNKLYLQYPERNNVLFGPRRKMSRREEAGCTQGPLEEPIIVTK